MLIEEEDPKIILMDVRISGERDGIETALEIREARAIPIVYVTASKEPETMERMMSSDPAAILIKPVLVEDLRKAFAEVWPLS